MHAIHEFIIMIHGSPSYMCHMELCQGRRNGGGGGGGGGQCPPPTLETRRAEAPPHFITCMPILQNYV